MNPVINKEALYAAYSAKVRSYVFGKIRNKEYTEDLVNEIFVKIYKKYDTFNEDIASVSTWIYTITRNTVTDYFRSDRTYSELPDDLCDERRTEDAILKKESLEALGKALAELDNRSRGVILWRYYEKMSLKEIAAQMGISYAYVKILHRNALNKLKDMLSD